MKKSGQRLPPQPAPTINNIAAKCTPKEAAAQYQARFELQKQEQAKKLEETNQKLGQMMDQVKQLNHNVLQSKTSNMSMLTDQAKALLEKNQEKRKNAAAPPIKTDMTNAEIQEKWGISEAQLKSMQEKAAQTTKAFNMLGNLALEVKSNFNEMNTVAQHHSGGVVSRSLSDSSSLLPSGTFQQQVQHLWTTGITHKRDVQKQLKQIHVLKPNWSETNSSSVRNSEYTCMCEPFLAGSRMQLIQGTYEAMRHGVISQYDTKSTRPTFVAHLILAPPSPEQHILPIGMYMTSDQKSLFVYCNLISSTKASSEAELTTPVRVAMMKINLNTFKADAGGFILLDQSKFYTRGCMIVKFSGTCLLLNGVATNVTTPNESAVFSSILPILPSTGAFDTDNWTAVNASGIAAEASITLMTTSSAAKQTMITAGAQQVITTAGVQQVTFGTNHYLLTNGDPTPLVNSFAAQQADAMDLFYDASTDTILSLLAVTSAEQGKKSTVLMKTNLAKNTNSLSTLPLPTGYNMMYPVGFIDASSALVLVSHTHLSSAATPRHGILQYQASPAPKFTALPPPLVLNSMTYNASISAFQGVGLWSDSQGREAALVTVPVPI